jgi:hypothetical protein
MPYSENKFVFFELSAAISRPKGIIYSELSDVAVILKTNFFL